MVWEKLHWFLQDWVKKIVYQVGGAGTGRKGERSKVEAREEKKVSLPLKWESIDQEGRKLT